MRYAKKFKKRFRKRNYRRSKLRYKKAIRSFKRKLNSVAEKKISAITTSEGDVSSAGSSTPIGQIGGLMRTSLPAIGTGGFQRIGSKIFVRYITYTMYIYNTDTDFVTNNVFILELRPKDNDIMDNFPIQDMTCGAGTVPAVNGLYLKNSFSKMKLHRFRIQAKAYDNTSGEFQGSALTNVVIFRRTIKVMKSLTISETNRIQPPDYYFWPLYFGGPLSDQTGAGKWRSAVQMSFTDV